MSSATKVDPETMRRKSLSALEALAKSKDLEIRNLAENEILRRFWIQAR